MSYPLHFFDEMVGELISGTYSIYPPKILKEKDLTETIEKEGRRVLRVLISEFYSSEKSEYRSTYFEKILKRLTTLKYELERLAKNSQKTFLLFGPSESQTFPELENFYTLYNQIHSFVCVIILEFEFNFEGVEYWTDLQH